MELKLKLKTCPFCGSQAYFKQISYGATDNNAVRIGFKIECAKCNLSPPNACGSVVTKLRADGSLDHIIDDREMAAEVWNRRNNNGE